MNTQKSLYHYPLCPFSRKVRLLLLEKGVSYGLINEKPWDLSPALLKVNPVGTLPVLVEEAGQILSDHVAICEYLAETIPQVNLLGETPLGRAEVRRLTNWFDTEFYADVLKPLLTERVFKQMRGGQSPDSRFIRAARENLKRYLFYLNWLCGRRSCLGGRQLSIADLAVAAHLSILDYLGEIPWGAYLDVKEWYSKIKSHPSFNSLLNDRITGIMPSSHYTDLDF